MHIPSAQASHPPSEDQNQHVEAHNREAELMNSPFRLPLISFGTWDKLLSHLCTLTIIVLSLSVTVKIKGMNRMDEYSSLASQMPSALDIVSLMNICIYKGF